MKYTILKTSTKKNAHTYVFLGDEQVAVCYGHLYRSALGKLKTANAVDDAKEIAAGLNLRNELIKLPSKVTKKQLLEIINKYKKL